MSLAAHPLCPSAQATLARDYRAAGYAVVRGVFTAAEIARLDAEAKQLAARTDLIDTNNLRCRWQEDASTGACLFDAFDPVVDLGPACANIATDSRLLGLVAAVYGEPGHLFKDKLIFKPPGASGYGLHQDYIAWPTFPRSFLTAVVAIDGAHATNGCIEVFPRVHERGLLTPADGNYHEIPDESLAGCESVKLELAPGDVALFGAFTPHRSGANRSRGWRRQLYLSYNAASDGGDYRETHYREFQAWLLERYAEYGLSEVYFT